MKFMFRVAWGVSLVALAAPAWAVQLGQIRVKSALNQPLVASIPLHPENLTELDGLTVSLAPAADFAQAGLQISAVDRTLQFHVVTDNNGQKLILVTSSQAITDPYLDFLVQVNTRQSKQVHEFVVLLNPVISSPAPQVQAAPVAATPQPAPEAAPQPAAQPAQSPSPAISQPAAQTAVKPASRSKQRPAAKPAAQAAKPAAKSEPKPALQPAKPASKPAPARRQAAAAPAPAPAPAPSAAESIKVAHGDTLYGIAQQQTKGSDVSINQMMLALKGANPDAFFKDNINDLKAGAILRIPTRDKIDAVSLAQANAEVHRQYEAWRASRPHPATVLEGTAAEAAAKAAPKPEAGASASDHLALVPPSGEGSGASSRAGVAGGSGKQTVAGLHRRLQNDRDALISVNQSNADLASRVQSLKDMTGKTDKLLSLKDATIADLQHRLAAMQAGESATGSAATSVAAAASSAAGPATKPKPVAAGTGKPGATQWYEQPLAWLVAGLVVLALIRFGLSRRRRGGHGVAVATGPLPDPEDIASPQAAEAEDAPLQADVAEDPDDLHAHLALCRFYYGRGDAERFIAAAESMHLHVRNPEGAEWRAVAMMGTELAPQHPLFAPADVPHDDPHGMAALHESDATDEPTVVRAVPHAPEPAPSVDAPDMADAHAVAEEPTPVPSLADANLSVTDDPVDTKLDLARAYLDMGDPVGARAMLEEVIEEGSQPQQDEAKRLLADVSG